MTSKARIEVANKWVTEGELSVRRACNLISMSRSQFKYKSKKKEDGLVVAEILKIKDQHPRYGVPRITVLLARRKLIVNRKRVYRICKTLNILALKKPKRNKIWTPPSPEKPFAVRGNHVWSMDFVTGYLQNGSKFRCFTTVDTYTRETPMIIVERSMGAFLPMRCLDNLKKTQALPDIIILDNGPEFANHALINWSRENKVHLHFIDPGEPVQNAYIESFNGRFRDECLNQNSFKSIADARVKIKEWAKQYNEERPHSSLDYLTPKEFALKEQRRISLQQNK